MVMCLYIETKYYIDMFMCLYNVTRHYVDMFSWHNQRVT